jgi:hypothetical protein
MPIDQNITVLKLVYTTSKARDTSGATICTLHDTSHGGFSYKSASAWGYVPATNDAFHQWFTNVFPEHPPIVKDKGYAVSYHDIQGILEAKGYHVESPYDTNCILIVKKGSI